MAETTAPPALEHVWEPLQIGPMRLKNRLIVPARVMNWSHKGVLSDRHLAHYAELAAGGPAMVVTEQHAAYPVAKGSFHNPCSAWEPAAVPRFARMAELLHAQDVRGAVELFGTGTHDKGTMMMDEWKPLWGVSDVPSVVHNEVPAVMSQREITQVVEGFAQSARNVRDGGLDGVEIHAAHGYLLCQFLSRIYNKRTDAYGGSLENRCRIILEVGDAVRQVVGRDLAVGLRMSYDEYVDVTGITPDEADQHISLFATSGIFDYFSISAGSYHTIHRSVAPMQEEDGYLVPLARRAKGIVGDRAAVFAVGRVRDLHLAEEIIGSGAADVVAMGRAQLADPHIVRKSKEGRFDEINRCTGVNECVGRLFDEAEVICMMNPVTGREQRWSDMGTATERRKVLVVGGGPAGLKLAAVAGRRGHDVTLVERSDRLGGHLNLLSSLPKQTGWETAVDDLTRAAKNAGVTIVMSTTVDPEYVRTFGADRVFVAEGAAYDDRGLTTWNPEIDEVPGIHSARVIAIDEAVRRVHADGPHALGTHVVIADEAGAYLPLGLSEILAAAGVRTQVVTGQLFVGAEADRQLQLPWIMPRLMDLGVEFRAQRRLASVGEDGVVLADRWSGASEHVGGVTTVVLSLYRRSRTDLYDALLAAGLDVERTGDGLAPRKMAELMYEGERLGRAI